MTCEFVAEAFFRFDENERRMKEEGHEDETLLECGTEVKPMTR